MRRHAVLLFCFLIIMAGRAQAQQSLLGAEFSQERDSFAKDCLKFKSPGGCAELLFTGHPLHISVGSIAPQNGFGVGPAFVMYIPTTKNVQLNLNADAVVSTNGSWRAGIYGTVVLFPKKTFVFKPGGTGKPTPKPGDLVYPVFRVYAQATSLNKIVYYGLGPNTTREDQSFFGMRETIVGANVTYPLSKLLRPLKLSLFGEANGRFVDIRGSRQKTGPSIEEVYTEAAAPGLTSQPAFAQFGEGVRAEPHIFADYLRFNYSLNFQQYVAAGDSQFSFRRLTVDLSHQIPLYKRTRTLAPLNHTGPDDCAEDPSGPDHKCQSIKGPFPNPNDPSKTTYDLEGSVNLRFLLTESYTSTGHVVPFYFQPTLGGSDINGRSSLASFQDYRFRAPNLMLLQGNIEHSLGRLPLGVTFMAETGKVAFTRGDIGFKHLRHSYAAGLTLRAGGFPMVYLMYAWGSGEGAHAIANMNTSLLGGSSRPSLY